MTSYLMPQFENTLYIPHIAEETDYWETEMFVSSLEFSDLEVKIGNNQETYSIPMFSTIVNLEDILGDNVDELTTWGTVTSVNNNPFGGTRSLSGFEIFQHNETDGAAVELQSLMSQTLFIPHIPEETDIFWTGFAVVNPNDEDANVVIDLYTKDGQLVKKVEKVIPAGTKLKALASDLFGNAYGEVEWGIIKSDRDIFGIEIYGTVADGICGFALPANATTDGYLPELIVGESLWNGIALTNPSNTDAVVSVSLVSRDGTVKDTKQIEIASMHRFKIVVKDLFDNVEIEEGDYLHYRSTSPVIAVEVSGDLDRKFMFSLIGKR